MVLSILYDSVKVSEACNDFMVLSVWCVEFFKYIHILHTTQQVMQYTNRLITHQGLGNKLFIT